MFVLIDAQEHTVSVPQSDLCVCTLTTHFHRFPKMFWDKGPPALKAFIQTHICNSLCEYLELDDLTDFDVDEIVMKSEEVRKVGVNATMNSQPSGETSGSDSRAGSAEHD